MIKRVRRGEKFSVGFTLIELLVVVAIIGILAAIILPTLNRARELANRAACLANLKDLGLATAMYVDDNKGDFPFDKTDPSDGRLQFALLYPDYEPDLHIFICPSAPKAVPATSISNFIANAPADAPRLSYMLQASNDPNKGFSDKIMNVTGGKAVLLMMDSIWDALNTTDDINGCTKGDGDNLYFTNATHAFIRMGSVKSRANHGQDGINVAYTNGSAGWVGSVDYPAGNNLIRDDDLPSYAQYKYSNDPENHFDDAWTDMNFVRYQ